MPSTSSLSIFVFAVAVTQVASLSLMNPDSTFLAARVKSVAVDSTCPELADFSSTVTFQPTFYLTTPLGTQTRSLLSSAAAGEATVIAEVPDASSEVQIRIGIDALLFRRATNTTVAHSCDNTTKIEIINRTLDSDFSVIEYRLSGACFTALVDVIRPSQPNLTVSTVTESSVLSAYLNRLDDPYLLGPLVAILSLTVWVVFLLGILVCIACRKTRIPKSHVCAAPSPTTTTTTHRSQTPPPYPSPPAYYGNRASQLVTPMDHVYEDVQSPFLGGTPRIRNMIYSYASPFSDISTPSATSTIHYNLV